MCIPLDGWEPRKKKKVPKQAALFVDLAPEEKTLVDVVKEKGKAGHRRALPPLPHAPEQSQPRCC
jgi:hypothetical protein